MAASTGGRSLEETPTWAVAVVCFILVLISIFIEFIIHRIGKWLKKRHKRALWEALEKIKSELMLLGFISLLLTVGEGVISNICISKKIGATWHPCGDSEETTEAAEEQEESAHGRKLLGVSGFRRVLASSSEDKCAAKNQVPFVSTDGIHQLHMFIFVLALFHVIYCILTMALGRAKMRSWKAWEKETRTIEYQFSHDPERFRFARETSFGRRHLSFWSNKPVLLWIVCFFRQFFRSVTKVDYLTLRHGFIMAHLAPQSHSKFDFQKYINRSLEEDFKVVVGISPPIWFLAVLFILFNVHGWYTYLWLPFIPLVVILLVGTKLQVIITKMGLRIQERGEVVKGVPVVQPGDDLFWFNSPRLLLFLINFVLFQNAFQFAFLAWSWFEFGFKSCFHSRTEDVVIRISMGVLIEILCSYVTLPLYALVTQMGSSMKPTIFNERVAVALRKWHRTARKNVKQSKHNSALVTPMSSRPATPSRGGMSPLPLLRHYRGETATESVQTSPRRSNFDMEQWETDGSLSPSISPSHPHLQAGEGSSSAHNLQLHRSEHEREMDEPTSSSSHVIPVEPTALDQQRIDILPKDFSFDRRDRRT